MDTILYEEIQVEKITRNLFMAKTVAWIESKPWLKMTFEIAERSELAARERLIQVLNAKPTICHE